MHDSTSSNPATGKPEAIPANGLECSGNSSCPKCGDVGTYMYDENHGTICEICCPHDEGWWLLKEHYGSGNGKYACKRGCGEIRSPSELGIEVPQFIAPSPKGAS